MSQNELIERNYTVGDRLVDLVDTLYHPDGTVFDLTGRTVALRVTTDVGATVIVAYSAGTIDSAAAGTVRYAWSSGDVALLVAGRYYCWWRATRTSDGKVAHFPADGRKRLLVFNTPA